MKYIYLIAIFLISLTPLKGQVKIGNTTPPEKFSILEIDAKKENEATAPGREIGGLRLPQWTDATANGMISTLTSKATESKGLLIYNKDKQYIQLWNGTTWIPLPSNTCTPVQTLTLSANYTTLNEYGTEDLVLTATADTGVSANADIVYRWTFNTNPIEGATSNTYTIKKENLSATHSGTYQVTAYSCGFTGTINDIVSNSVTITVTPKVYSMVLTLESETDVPDGRSLNFKCTYVNQVPTELVIVDDPEHVYTGLSSIAVGPTAVLFNTGIYSNKGNRNGYNIKFKAIDDIGNESNVITITEPPYAPKGNDIQVGTYFLYGESTDHNAADAMERCRSRAWTGPKRASLMSVDFLNENKTLLEATQSIVPTGNYWLMDGKPTMYTVSYTGGDLILAPVPGEPVTNTHVTRCIAPY